jgi:hypothetical protein
MVSAAGDIPDAIGWKYGFSYMVECKASRSDFHANKNKPHERVNSGVGCHRFFLCVPEIIKGEDLSSSDYGLLWLGESGVIRVRKEPVTRDTNHHKEICMLTSALRRVRTREFLTINIFTEEASGLPLETGAVTASTSPLEANEKGRADSGEVKG